ncbi:hypothetical protein ACVNRM_06970 [Bacillus paranthracis]|uniref:hypothetical protein n=1 Tax=Bacillus TaxID=1386 RepID=UPI0002792509|nr:MULTISPECIES: hypothetical protein [Bacillus]EJQ04438.1 hypothetical protein IC5_02482 [Bacillus cereus AND1407]KMP89639.1 hypothetical protein TU64_01330 [Bacillus cereus]KAB7635592.1 hypothetical protein GBN96_17345 [Bacillus sp. B4-WWTP-NA-D-NA-NA]KXI48195.1 hypothetical protein ACS45_25145 [Bacillus cereus]MDG0908659.1 hypothetical protein [Bacillus paranthracis]
MGYIYDILSSVLLIAGIITMILGKKKNNPKLRGIGIGIGIVTAVLIIGLPDFAKGYMKGVLSAGDSTFPIK